MPAAWLLRWRVSFGIVLVSLLSVGDGAAQAHRPAQPADSTKAGVDLDGSERLESAYLTLDALTSQTYNLFDTKPIATELPELAENLHAIRHSVAETGRVFDVKQVQMCQLMLDNIQQQLTAWRTELSLARQQYSAVQSRLKALTLLPVLSSAATDSSATQTLAEADAALSAKKQRTTRVLAQRLQAVARLQSQVSTSYIQTLELQDQVSGQLRGFGRRTFAGQYPYLWTRAAREVVVPPVSPHLQEARQRIIAFYFGTNWDNWVYMALMGLVFFGWVTYNYRRVPAHGEHLALAQPLRYLQPWPLAATGVVMFSLAPALELRPPPVYLDVLQGLLLLALTGVFWRSWPRSSFWSWLALVGFFAVLAVSNAGDGASLGTRGGLLLLNGLAPFIGAYFLLRIRRRVQLPHFVVPITFLFIGLNVVAGGANILGRLSLAKLLSTAAIFGLTQGIGLAVLIQLLTEAFHLQMLASRSVANGPGFDYDKIGASLMRLLSVVVGGMWLLVFTANLALQGVLYKAISNLLTAPRVLGSTQFTLGNVALFFFILYVSARLQQYIGYFFGEIGEEADTNARHRGSWLVALRLFLVLVGVGLAVTASGYP
ncbi:hypothetical protein [Hymenobacter sp. BRD67]|uniref:hypothetical protein n=1 Tax=Hymenobacter sp. BRD67 TaxID=2675877 RepID=UPI00156664E7|nr:hypothetical protein [Hymenobacter sp. BRD67]QKG54300.1 hypothetical protein GKZ67_18985 [Hymenobacter sp. BRD67]